MCLKTCTPYFLDIFNPPEPPIKGALENAPAIKAAKNGKKLLANKYYIPSTYYFVTL